MLLILEQTCSQFFKHITRVLRSFVHKLKMFSVLVSELSPERINSVSD